MINLRAIEWADLRMMKAWRNSPDILPHVREYRLLSDWDQQGWFANYEKTRRDSEWGQEIMIIELDGKSVGIGGFTRIQWKNRIAEFTFFMPDQPPTHIIENVILLLLKKGFDEFGFHKVTWPVYGHNPYLWVYQEIFNVEAILREEYFYEKMQDRYYLSLLHNEYYSMAQKNSEKI